MKGPACGRGVCVVWAAWVCVCVCVACACGCRGRDRGRETQPGKGQQSVCGGGGRGGGGVCGAGVAGRGVRVCVCAPARACGHACGVWAETEAERHSQAKYNAVCVCVWKSQRITVDVGHSHCLRWPGQSRCPYSSFPSCPLWKEATACSPGLRRGSHGPPPPLGSSSTNYFEIGMGSLKGRLVFSCTCILSITCI